MNNEVIPLELRKRRQWVLWDWVVRDGRKTKVPKRLDGTNARPNDPRTWHWFEEVADHERIGFVFTAEDPYCGIDVDGAMDPETGELADWGSKFLDHCAGQFAERSPSGSGWKLIVRGSLPRDVDGRPLCKNRAPIPNAPQLSEKSPEIEVYDDGRFWTITRAPMGETAEEIADGQALIDKLAATLLKRPETERDEAAHSASPTAEDAEVLDRAFRARNGGKVRQLYDGDTSGYGSHSEADFALVGLLRFYTQDPEQLDRLFRASGLMRSKWDERHFGNGTTYGEETIRRGLAGNFQTYQGRQEPPSAPAWPEPPHEAAFYGLAGRIVSAIDPYTEADPVAVLVNVLAATGAAVGPNPHFMVGATRHPAREYFALVGRSGKARKGDSQHPVTAIFRIAEPGFESRLVSGLSTGEGLIHALRDPVEKEEQDKATGNMTTVVVDAGVADKRLLVVEPEFGRVLKVQDRQGNTLSAVVRDAWDYHSLEILTKTKARSTHPHITLVGHITGEELRRELDSNSAANGFANRIIFMAVQRSKELPRPRPFEGQIVADLASELSEVLNVARHVREMDFDADANEAWHEVYHELSGERLGLAGAILNRAEAHALRLSMLYALMDGSALITIDHLTAALALWEYAERSAYYIFGDASGDPIADRILDGLREQGPMSRSDISSFLDRNTPKSAIDAALSRLQQTNRAVSWIERQEGQAGRPREMWRAA